MDIYHEVRGAVKQSIVHSSPFHRHTGYELYLFLSGHANFFTEKEGFLLQPGYLVLVSPGTWHKAKTFDNTLYQRAFTICSPTIIRTLGTPQTDLSQCFKNANPNHPTVIQLTPAQIKTFVAAVQTIQTCSATKIYGNDLLIRNALTTILLLANQAATLTSPLTAVDLPDLVAQMLLFIDLNLQDTLSIDRFAREFFMNGAYLSRYFKKFTGITLQAYIIDKRIEQTKSSLLHCHTVEEAAANAGFNNYANFIRTFKQHVGMSPGVFKKSQLVR